MYIKKRWLITSISFVVGGLLVLMGFVISFYCSGENYKTTMSYPQKENIISLAESLEQIDYSLKKGSYATTPYQAVILAANVLLETGSAKEDLQHLPIYDLALEKTAKYLSQTGEFVFKLAEKGIRGESITEDDQNSLRQLSEKATELASELRNFSVEVSSENYDYDTLAEMLKSQSDKNDAVSVMAGAAGETSAENGGNVFERIETSFEDFSPIYYDGRFSDVIEREPDEFWNDKEIVTQEKALDIAAYVMDVSLESVKFDGETVQDDFECYRFSAQNGDKEICIIKQGGYLYSYNNNINIGDAVKSEDEAVAIAEKFLKKIGLDGMSVYGRVYNGNIMLLTFVSEKNGVLIYPEKITVGVALDKGEIVSFNGSDYWTNLKLNRTFTSSISQDEAAKSVSPELLVKNVNKVFMISDGGNEYPCYEFVTESERDGQVRVYINSETGVEETIILVSETDEGTFFY